MSGKLCAVLFLSFPAVDVLADTDSNSASAIAIVCMRVEEVRYSKSQSGEPNRFPYLIKLTSLKRVSGISDEKFEVGRMLEFRIHSPARTFNESENKMQGQIFRIEFVKSDDIWVLANATEDLGECGQ